MAQSPQYKVYRGKEYIAACKYAEDAAAMVSLAGGTVKYGHNLLVWKEGAEQIQAGESYDGAARIMHESILQANREGLRKLGWSEEEINANLAA